MKKRLEPSLKDLLKKTLIKYMGEMVEENEGPQALIHKFSSIIEFADRYLAIVEENISSRYEPGFDKKEAIKIKQKRNKKSKITGGLTLHNPKE